MLKTRARVNAVSRNERLGSNGRIFSFTMPKYNLNDVLIAQNANGQARLRAFVREKSEILRDLGSSCVFISRFDPIQLCVLAKNSRRCLFRPQCRRRRCCCLFSRSLLCVMCACAVCDELFDVPVTFNSKDTRLLKSREAPSRWKAHALRRMFDRIRQSACLDMSK